MWLLRQVQRKGIKRDAPAVGRERGGGGEVHDSAGCSRLRVRCWRLRGAFVNCAQPESPILRAPLMAGSRGKTCSTSLSELARAVPAGPERAADVGAAIA